MKSKTLLAALLAGQMAWALPENGQVIQGNVQIGSPQGNILQILQSSPTGIINWGSFSIDRNQLVQFLQPGSNAALLNRVIGQDPSQILGQLQANGRILLVNPNGILFGPGSTVNAGSFLASTLQISDDDFLAGRYDLKADPASPLTAITNQGEIKVADGGFITLVAPLVHNQGLLVAQQGQVVLGATTQASLTVDARGLLQVTIPNGFMAHNPPQGPAGTVLLTQGQMSDTLASLISPPANQSERIVETAQGIQLVGSEGLLVNEGTIRVDAPQGTAGRVLMDSSLATINTPGSLVSAMSQQGNGGEILVLSAGTTRQQGGLSVRSATGGDGGFIEVSGRRLSLSQRPDLSAPQGKAGTLLLDPTVLHISNNPSTLPLPVNAGDGGANENVEATMLDTGGVVTLQATENVIVDAGTVVTLNNDTDIQVLAQNRDFLMEAGSAFVGNNPGASLTVTAGRDAQLTDVRLSAVSVTAGGQIRLNTGSYGIAGSPTLVVLNGGSVLATADTQVDLLGSTVQFNASGSNGITAEPGSRIRANSLGNLTLTSSGGEVNLRNASLEAPVTGSNITVSANGQLSMGSSLAPTTNLHSDTFVQFNNSTVGVSGQPTALNVTAGQGIPFFAEGTTNVLGSTANITMTSQGDAGIFDNHQFNLNNSQANVAITAPAGFFLSPGAAIVGQGALNLTISSLNPNADFLMASNTRITAPGPSRVDIRAGNSTNMFGSIHLPNAASNVSLQSLGNVTRVNQVTTGGSVQVQTSAGNVRILDHIEANDVRINTAGNLIATGSQVGPYIIAHNRLDLTAQTISGPLNLPDAGLVSAFPLATDGSAIVRIQVTGNNQSELGNRAANLYYYFPSSNDTQVTANNGDVLLYRQPDPNPPANNTNSGTLTSRNDLTPAQNAELTGQSAIVQIQLSNLYSLNDLPSTSSVLMLSYDNPGLTHFSPVSLGSPLVELVVLSPEAAAKHQSTAENQANSMILAGNDEDEELRYWRKLIEGFILWEE